jgi:hypothetical protein
MQLKIIKYMEGKIFAEHWKLWTHNQCGQFLTQLPQKLAAPITQALYKCFMSKNVSFLSDMVGQEGLYKLLHSPTLIFFI